MLDIFRPPPTVTCFLCKASVSVQRGDKSRFLQHVANDHEVHFDRDLVYVLSTMEQGQREAIVNNNTKSSDIDNTFCSRLKRRLLPSRTMNGNTATGDGTEEQKEKVDSEGEEMNSVLSVEEFKPKKLRIDIRRINFIPEKENVLEEAVEVEEVKEVEDSGSKLSKCSKTDKSRSQLPTPQSQRNKSQTPRRGKKKVLTECFICEEKFYEAEQRTHMKQVHNTDRDYDTVLRETLGCSTSGLAKIQKKDKEEEVVKETRPFQKCEICGGKVEAAKMEIHLRGYHEGKYFKCGLCYEILARRDQLRRHLTEVHRDEQDLLNHRLEPNFSINECKVKCPQCTMSFMTAFSRDYHLSSTHQGM